MKVKNFTTMRDAYGQALLDFAKKSDKLWVLTADLSSSTRVLGFAQKYPERFVQCGVSEQNMMGVAAGLACEGLIPTVNSFAVFSPGRNWDQLRNVCLSNLNVKIIGHHTGFSASFDGGSHQALEDIAITRVLPNLIVLTPNDANEAYWATFAALQHKGPIYLRLSKYPINNFTKSKEFKIGEGEVLHSGKDLTLISAGPLTQFALEVLEKAKGKIDIELLKLNSIKPLPEKLILDSIKKTGQAMTIEDHQIIGGLGSAVVELLSSKLPVKVYRHGVSDQFGQSGSMQELLQHYKLDTEGIWQTICANFGL